MDARNILIFGGRGAIGGAVGTRFAACGWNVTATSRSEVRPGDGVSTWITYDPDRGSMSPSNFDVCKPYAAVCWAQGANHADSVFNVDSSKHLELYRANCVFVLETLRILLDRDLLTRGARLVIVSSIWQNIARQDKLSYIMSKAAIGGLVRSASIDLASRGILINAVLPSVLDTVMTSQNLTTTQIEAVAKSTGFGRLCTLDEVAAAIEFLCSERNGCITGQSLTLDLGFAHARFV